jgi:hypothetical protein
MLPDGDANSPPWVVCIGTRSACGAPVSGLTPAVDGAAVAGVAPGDAAVVPAVAAGVVGPESVVDI